MSNILFRVEKPVEKDSSYEQLKRMWVRENRIYFTLETDLYRMA